MDNIYDFFAKPKDPKVYQGVQISLASSDQIREWSHGEIKNRKPSITGHSSRSGMDCSVPRCSALPKITSVTAVSTSG